jgi:hypothetical protein
MGNDTPIRPRCRVTLIVIIKNQNVSLKKKQKSKLNKNNTMHFLIYLKPPKLKKNETLSVVSLI